MQEWLKDKKNLPIVVVLAVFVLLAAGGLVAFELGAFSGSSTVATAPPTGGAPSIGPAGFPTSPPGVPPPGLAGGPGRPPYPQGGRPVLPGGAVPPPALGTAAAVKKPAAVNPLIGPDPFKIPGGAKKEADAQLKLLGPKPALRDQIGPLNLFQLRPPAPPVPPALPDGTGAGGGTNPTANYRLAGVVTGSDGINAILEVGGQSQSVKPGDTLPDGTQVQNIQTSSVTLRTASGATVNLPLSAGAPDQGNGYNGPGQYPGGQFQPGQFRPGGFGGPPFDQRGGPPVDGRDN